MHVIGGAANALGDSVGGADDPSKIRVQFAAPRSLDHRLVVLRSKNDVIMQAQVR